MNIAIACGGTGGHLFPGLAVGEALLARGHDVLLILSEKEIDSVGVEGRDEFRIARVPSRGMPAWYSPAMLSFLGKSHAAYRGCLRTFAGFPPCAVLGMGGFTSTPPILAGRKLGVPTFIHESNVVPGKANRLNAKLSRRVLLGFGEASVKFGNTPCLVTGTPVRSALVRGGNPLAARASLGLDPDRTTMLVMGGSQGAGGINHALCRIAAKLGGTDIQILHLTGGRDEATVRTTYQENGIPHWVCAFHPDMQTLYTASHFAVARSGASSLSELAFFGIPSLLVPYPFAADDHQTHNAEVYSREGAGVVLKEGDGLGEKLLAQILRLSADPSVRQAMGEAARAHAPEGAADKVADCIEAAAH